MKKNNLIKKVAAISCAFLLGLTTIPAVPTEAANSMPDFSCLGAVGTLTETQTISVAESIYKAMTEHSNVATFDSSSRSKRISITTDNMESIRMIYHVLISEYEVGILAKKVSLNYGRANGYYIGTMRFGYYVDDSDYDATYKTVMNQLDEISALVLDEWSDEEKALFLHDYLAYHYDFDQTEYETEEEEYVCHSAYGMLTRNMGVCEGYACLYSMLLNREGIETHLMTSDKLGHAWNIVKIDDKWYHVDVTWDDFYYHEGAMKHNSFLKNAEDMRLSNHTQDDWKTLTKVLESDMDVAEESLDGFWKNSNAIVQYRDGQWFAVTSTDANKYTVEYCWYDYDPTTKTAEKTSLTSDTRYWVTPENAGIVYVGNYSVPAFYKDVIFYSTPNSVFLLNGKQPYWLFDLTEEQKAEGQIFAIHIEGDTLYYDVAPSPNDEGVEYALDLTQYADEYIGSLFTTTEETTTTTTTTTKPTTSTTTTTTTTKPTTSTTTTTATTKPTTSTTTTTATTKPTTSTTTTTATTKPTTSTTTTTATTKPTTSTTTTTATTKPTTSTTTTTATTKPTTSTTTTATTSTTTTTETTTLAGDVNFDNAVSVSDVILLQHYLHKVDSFTKEQFLTADLNADKTVNVIDLALLKQRLINQ